MPDVFYGDVSGVSPVCELQPISKYRREKLKSLRHEDAYRRSLGAELLLLTALRSLYPDVLLPPYVSCGEFGKPYMEGLHFNLSHSRKFAVCAVGNEPVGVDVQRRSEFKQNLASRFFSPGECGLLMESCDKDADFTRLWCLKESYLKYLGLGLNKPLSSFEVDLSDPLKPSLVGDPSVKLWSISLGDHFLSLCYTGDGEINVNEVKLP